jgi:hypothetical protein
MSKIEDLLKAAREKAEQAKKAAQIKASVKPVVEIVPDPLTEVDYGGTVEEDADKELSALLTGFKERAKAEQDRFEQAVDGSFWFAICFQSTEQKEAFISAVNWGPFMEYGDQYVNGLLVAKAMNVQLDVVELKKPKPKRDKKLTPLT